MSLQIDEPIGQVNCDCGTVNKVTVKGHGAIYNGVTAVAVYAKIYQPPDAPVNPSNGPPAGADSDEDILIDGSWSFGKVGGADCTSSSPYPDNTVWAWAKHLKTSSSSSSSSEEEYFYQTANSDFTGKCP